MPLDAPAHCSINGPLHVQIPHNPGMMLYAGPDGVDEGVRVIARQTDHIATDIETFGLGPLATRIKCVSIASTQAVVVLDPRDPRQADLIRTMYGYAESITLHNSTFDAPSLYRNGLLAEYQVAKIWDTLIWARLAWPDVMVRKSLGELASRLLDIPYDASLMKLLFAVNGWRSAKQGWENADLDLPAYVVGAGMDAVVTARLHSLVRERALDTLTRDHPFTRWGVQGEEAQRLVDREQQVNRLFLRRACRGLQTDQEFATRYAESVDHGQHIREQALTAAGVRPGNGQDLAKALDLGGTGKAHWPRTKTGFRMRAADVEVLAETSELAEQFLIHKRTKKIKSDYLDKVFTLADQFGRIHPVTNILGATTGRASMGDPPLHQFPEGARGIIVPDAGDTFTSIDWSQQEPVVVANMAGDDAALVDYEQNNRKFYYGISEAAGVDYKQAKVILLATLYGEGLPALAASLGIDTDEAERLTRSIFRVLPKTKQLINRLKAISREHRKVFTLSGRILSIPIGEYPRGSGNWSVQAHKGVNYVVQGSGWDLMAESLVAIDEAGLGDAVYLTLHDEMVASTSAAEDIQRIMATPPARLVELAGRVPVLNTDSEYLGARWKKV